MTRDFKNAVSRLLADANGIAFTAFVTNARLDSPPAMIGEVWSHVKADELGRFADGHRIQTSHIVEVHAAGQSLWVVTENGSRYGIISFAALGWKWFSDLLRETKTPTAEPVCINLRERELSDLGQDSPTKPLKRTAHADPALQTQGRHPLRPPSGERHLQQYKTNFDKSIAELRRHGVVVSHRALDKPESDDQ